MQLTATDRAAIAPHLRHNHPEVAVDIIALAYTQQELKLLLIRRAHAPYTGGHALPGGFIKAGQETAPQAVLRELESQTGAVLDPTRIEQLGFYTELNRDPRGPIYSSAYIALLPQEIDVKAKNDALDAEWFTLTFTPEQDLHLTSETTSYTLHKNTTQTESPLAFDHHRLIFDAIDRIRSGLFYKNQALELLGPLFTLPAVSDLYSLLLYGQTIKRKWKTGDLLRRLDKAVIATDQSTEGVAHRPATLYRRNPATKHSAL